MRVFGGGAFAGEEVTVQRKGRVLSQLQAPGWCLEATWQAGPPVGELLPVLCLQSCNLGLRLCNGEGQEVKLLRKVKVV